MARNISTRISLDGEAEFRKSMTLINTNMRELQSELKLTSSDFDGLANSETALQQKGEILSKMVDLQKSKVEELRNAMLQSAEANGENSEETVKLRTELNRATVDLNEMMRALDENAALLEEAAGNADGLATSIDEYGKKVKKASENTTEFGNKSGTAFKDAASALVASGILQKLTELAGKFKAITTAAAAYADSIITMSVTTGLSTDTLQEFKYASELIDVSLSTLSSSLRRVTTSMKSASNGTGEAAEAYKKLGVNITDTYGKLRNNEDVFWDSINALGEISNETERDALAMEIFGKSAQELNTLIEAGAEAFKKLASEARETGYVLEESTLAKLGAMDDSFQRFKNASEAAGNAVGAAFAPALQGLTDAATNALNSFTSLAQESPTFVNAIGAIASSFTGLATVSAAILTVKKSIDLLKPSLTQLSAAMNTSIAGLVGGLSGVAVLLGAVAFDVAEITRLESEADSYYETHLAEATEAYTNAVNDLEAAKEGIGPVSGMDAASQEAYIANLEKMVAKTKERMEAAQEYANAAEVETGSDDARTESIGKVKDSLDELIAAYNEAYDAALKSAQGSTGIFEQLATDASTSVDTMVQNLGTQNDFFSNYAGNLNMLKDIGLDSGMLAKLADGSAESAGYVQSIVNSYNELANSGSMEAAASMISGLNTAYEESQRAMEEFAVAVANSKVDIEQGIEEIAGTIEGAAGDFDQQEAMVAAGKNTIAGYLDGLGDGSAIAERMRSIAASAIAAFNDALEIHSPSRVFARSGRFTIQGFNEGVKAETEAMEKTMTEAANTAIESFNVNADDLGAAAAPAGQSGSNVVLNVYAQTLDEAQTDYLVDTVNRRLGA